MNHVQTNSSVCFVQNHGTVVLASVPIAVRAHTTKQLSSTHVHRRQLILGIVLSFAPKTQFDGLAIARSV